VGDGEAESTVAGRRSADVVAEVAVALPRAASRARGRPPHAETTRRHHGVVHVDGASVRVQLVAQLPTKLMRMHSRVVRPTSMCCAVPTERLPDRSSGLALQQGAWRAHHADRRQSGRGVEPRRRATCGVAQYRSCATPWRHDEEPVGRQAGDGAVEVDNPGG
jgi:hypothetical protein